MIITEVEFIKQFLEKYNLPMFCTIDNVEGKTIKRCEYSDSYLFIIFDDNTYTVVEPEHKYNYDDDCTSILKFQNHYCTMISYCYPELLKIHEKEWREVQKQNREEIFGSINEEKAKRTIKTQATEYERYLKLKKKFEPLT